MKPKHLRFFITIHLMAVLSVEVNAQSTQFDVNRDRYVNSADVVAIYNYIINGEASGFAADATNVNGDIDEEGKPSVNSADAVAVYNYIIDGFVCPDANHPHAIDLGLPSGTKWACCNVGADSPESCGGYYAWGEIIEKENYNINNYTHYDGHNLSYINLGDSIAATEWDVATVLWLNGWQMPTLSQFRELYYNTDSQWIAVQGTWGREFVGKNGAMIFMPAAGGCSYDKLFCKGTDGYYWTATQHPGYAGKAYMFSFGEVGSGGCVPNTRVTGYSVRPVAK